MPETLAGYGTTWIATRIGLRNSTRHQYGVDFRRHIEPYLGTRPVSGLDPATVRAWQATLRADLRAALAGPDGAPRRPGRDGSATAARAYRLLRAMLATAVQDGLLETNPCQIRGASEARAPARPVLSINEIVALADAVPAPYRAFILLAGLSGLRVGELAALRLADLDLAAGAARLRVVRRVYRVAGRLEEDLPKSAAGMRTVVLPDILAVELAGHLRTHRSGARPEDLVFVTGTGRGVLDRYAAVCRAGLDAIGRPDARTHDLRHSALTLAAEHGATLATLMQMAGHASPAAAQRYQHATLTHARAVAAAINASAAGLLNPGVGR